MTDAGRWRSEGKEHGGIKPPIYYPPTGKAHAAGPEHDPNRSHSPPHKRGISWHDIPKDKKYPQTGKLAPHPGETDPHITYRTGHQLSGMAAQ
ncbi:hypothetical protein C0989_003399 [Termitomyces sp. Mn162]|nr:hypothetical protein C0989_003399 [Termitomyces sp. Mn162]